MIMKLLRLLMWIEDIFIYNVSLLCYNKYKQNNKGEKL